MQARLQFAPILADSIQQLARMSYEIEKSIGESLYGLVHNRASQINGCAFCLDMDVKKAKLRGESELRMYHVAVWRDSNLFTERERVALAWTEVVTKLTGHEITDELFDQVRAHFSEKELAQLTLAIGLTNVWNRLNVSFRNPPGSNDVLLGLDKSGLR